MVREFTHLAASDGMEQRQAPLRATGLTMSAAAIALWTMGLSQGISVFELENGRSIFINLLLAGNYCSWAAVLCVVCLLCIAVLTDDQLTLSMATILVLLTMAATPYLYGPIRSPDSFSQMGFARYVAAAGGVAPSLLTNQNPLVRMYSNWPGSSILSATVLITTLISPDVLLRLYPVLNISIFAAGIYLLSRLVFQDSRKALYSVMFVFLGSNVIFYEYQNNWNSFSLIPLSLAGALSRDRRKYLLSVIMLSQVTVSHAFNATFAIAVLLAMLVISYGRFGNKLSAFLGFLVLWFSWSSFIGVFGLERIVDLMVNTSGSSIVESALITTGYVLLPQSISQIAGRYLLLVVVVSAVVSIMKREYVFLALPTLALLGAGYLTMHLLSGSDMWLALRTIAPGYLMGFPLAASTICDYAFHKRPAPRLRIGRRKILLLLFCGTLLLTYVMFAYNNERYFVVSQVQMSGSGFVGQSLEKMEKVGLCSFVHPPLEVYYLSPTKMPLIVPMSDREFQYADFILVDETWFSDSTTPDMPQHSHATMNVKQFVETRLDRVYSNSYVKIYVNPTRI